MKFESMPLSAKTRYSLKVAKLETCTEIQAASIPHALAGRCVWQFEYLNVFGCCSVSVCVRRNVFGWVCLLVYECVSRSVYFIVYSSS